jgi:hypothetical protein
LSCNKGLSVEQFFSAVGLLKASYLDIEERRCGALGVCGHAVETERRELNTSASESFKQQELDIEQFLEYHQSHNTNYPCFWCISSTPTDKNTDK